ncbi:MAG: exosortase/archaeosortase family protein [Bacteroidales bacterium]|nr:exosortase/archaeosortase family protein [Bacteroidales bacterium]
MKKKNNKKENISSVKANGTRSDKSPKPLFSKELLLKLLPLIKAFALWFILVMIIHIPGIKDAFREMIVGLTTSSTVMMGKLFFLPIKRLGFATIMVNNFTMQIIVECTAYNFYLFAIALSVFANWKIKHKLINFLIFVLIIFLTNNLRFFAMGYVGRYYPELFDTTHDYIWNILFGFMIFGVWAWRDRVNNPDFQPKEPQP